MAHQRGRDAGLQSVIEWGLLPKMLTRVGKSPEEGYNCLQWEITSKSMKSEQQRHWGGGEARCTIVSATNAFARKHFFTSPKMWLLAIVTGAGAWMIMTVFLPLRDLWFPC